MPSQVYVMSISFSYMHKSDVGGNCLNSSEQFPLIRTELKLLSEKKGMCQSDSGNVFLPFCWYIKNTAFYNSVAQI